MKVQPLFEMAFPRQRFMNKFENELTGAFGEFVCNEISKRVGFPDYWTKEVGRLVRKMLENLDPTKITLKVKGNPERVREKAIIEVLNDFNDVLCIRHSKNKVMSYPAYEKVKMDVDLMEIYDDGLFDAFIKQYLPERYHNFRAEK